MGVLVSSLLARGPPCIVCVRPPPSFVLPKGSLVGVQPPPPLALRLPCRNCCLIPACPHPGVPRAPRGPPSPGCPHPKSFAHPPCLEQSLLVRWVWICPSPAMCWAPGRALWLHIGGGGAAGCTLPPLAASSLPLVHKATPCTPKTSLPSMGDWPPPPGCSPRGSPSFLTLHPSSLSSSPNRGPL